MTTTPPSESSTAELLQKLETLRAHLLDLEAIAHAAAEALEGLPYLPSPQRAARSGHSDKEIDASRNYQRMQSLVIATAEGVQAALEECDDIIQGAHRDRSPEGTGSGNGPDKPGGGHGNGQNGSAQGAGGIPPALATRATTTCSPTKAKPSRRPRSRSSRSTR